MLDGVLTLLTLALSRERDAVIDEDQDDWEEEGEDRGRKKEEQDDNGSFTALTTADVAAVMAVVRSQQCRLILHERLDMIKVLAIFSHHLTQVVHLHKRSYRIFSEV